MKLLYNDNVIATSAPAIIPQSGFSGPYTLPINMIFTKAQLLTFRLGQLRNEGRATSAQISMAKRNNVEIAMNIARQARQIHGGMGITSEYSMMRHMANLESVVTYEGTHDIHLLITGMDVTGIPAFTREMPDLH
jgi:glutaryl-CoA dehydrogenase